MNRGQLQTKLQSTTKLPTLPAIALEVNRLLLDCEAPMEPLVALLQKDQALTMKILRLVNSSFYGFKNKIQGLGHAVTLLGYNTIRNAVVAVSVMDTLALKNELKGFEIDSFWTHSVRVAVASRYLALKTRLAPAEDAFTSGLLHDIGKVVLAIFCPQELVGILETARDDGLIFYAAERKLDSWPHSQIGAFLAQRWMLPDTLVQPIGHHHGGTDHGVQDPLSSVVAIGNSLVHMMSGEAGYGLALDGRPPEIQKPVTGVLGNPEWFGQIKQEMDNACQFFKQG
ncbi:MAG: HDOD domain-containing protein [Desulfatitalea sp.]